MANKNYPHQQDSTSLIRQRFRNRSIQNNSRLAELHTIDYDSNSPMALSQRDPAPHDIFSYPKIALPTSVMKELQTVVARHPIRTIRLDKRLYNKEKARAGQLQGWSLQGKVWTKPRSNVTVDDIINHLEDKRKNAQGKEKIKDLSLDLYSRMINSFKNSYKSARKAFEKKQQRQNSIKSLSRFERKYLPSKLMSNYIPFALTSSQQVHKSHKAKSSSQSPSMIKTKSIKPMTLVMKAQQQEQRPDGQMRVASPRSTQIHLKNNRMDEKPWRTNAKFPRIIAGVEIATTTKRNFTPWKISEVDEDITHYI